MVEIVGGAEPVALVKVPVQFRQERKIVYFPGHGQTFVGIPRGLEKIQQCEALAVGIAAYQSLISLDGWRRNWTCCFAKLFAQIRTQKVFPDAFKGKKV